ncbi:uncharacterized protein LOC113863032 isoform X1 [Abrus precatorius]|uniref:Uncharacterized protein LOC113863032 isoform X1 n=1 Tax=Abrus precatorius TaxID=3816 RepID=A0A8B8L7L5_ABRPR|nr:uncharacterized protein LOC113863032 isoform X1 [Abrus precatorius]
MAATPSSSDEQIHPLKVLVDKQTNKVLFAEADKDFVDVLLSFLTLPLGTIARLVAKESNIEAVRVGSLSSLYESVAHLEEEHLCTPTCKEMLLQPRNSMEAYCQQLRLNIDDTDPTKFFLCENLECNRKCKGLVSLFRNQRCSCGKLMNTVLTPKNIILEKGFVKETATFIVSDDLYITPNVFGASVNLFQKLGIEYMETVEEQIVDITKKEVVDLLKFSLISETPMTDFVLKKELCLDNFIPINQYQFKTGEVPSDEGRKMVVKVQLRKSDGKIVFAEANEDFANFLYSFLTFPLGGVLHMLKGSSSLSCIDKLYKSMTELSSDRYLNSQELKEKLANPLCAPQFNLSNQILPIGAKELPTYYFNSSKGHNLSLFTLPKSVSNYGERNAPLNIVDPRSPAGKSSDSQGFAKEPSMYMVTDDLVVTPMSSISAVSYLNRLRVPLFDLEERVITIGVKEGLGILKASLTSTSALTNGLKHLTKESDFCITLGDAFKGPSHIWDGFLGYLYSKRK